MPHRLTRASIARLIVGMAVLAFPLLATGVAQASIAGAAPASTISVGPPDLVSATVIDSTHVNVCFDKVIALDLSSDTGFALAGYRTGNYVQSTDANIDSLNTKCAYVTFGGSSNFDFPSSNEAPGQIDKFTIVEVAPGAVLSDSTSATNAVADSVALTPSSTSDQSMDGTRGITTGPNLVSISAPSEGQSPPNGDQLTFNFDRDVNVPNDDEFGDADYFWFATPAGDICEGTDIAGGNGTSSITVDFTENESPDGASCSLTPPFGTAGPDSVTTAFRGGLFADGIQSVQDPNSLNVNMSSCITTIGTAIGGGSSCNVSQRPLLVSATLNPSNLDQVTFTYDRDITIGPAFAYLVELSNTQNGPGVFPLNAVQTSPTQITVTFQGLGSVEAEYAVVAWSPYCAVLALGDLDSCSLPSSTPIGSNAGALSSGFTTGADVMGVNISGSGTVTVVTDQRLGVLGVDTLFQAVNGGVSLLDAEGQVVSPALPSTAALNQTGPGTYTFTLTYTPYEVASATMVAFGANALRTPLLLSDFVSPTLSSPFTGSVAADMFSVPQIVSSTANAGQLKPIKVTKKTVKKVKKD